MFTLWVFLIVKKKKKKLFTKVCLKGQLINEKLHHLDIYYVKTLQDH